MRELTLKLKKLVEHPKFLEVIYFLGIVLLCIKFYVGKLYFEFFNDNYIAIIFILLFIIKIIFQKNSLREKIWIVFLLAIGFLMWLICKETLIFYLFLVICASKDIEIKKTIKVIFSVNFGILFLLSFVYLYNFCYGKVPVINRPDRIRYTLYFLHPNNTAGMIFWTISQYIYLNFEKMNLKKYVQLFLILVITYFFTDSRTVFLVSSLFLIIMYLYQNHFFKSILEKIINITSKYIFIICTITMLSLGLLYNLNDNNILHSLDRIVNGRISLLSIGIEKYGIAIFPSDANLQELVESPLGGQIPLNLDSIYSRFLIKEGLFFILLFNYLLYEMTKYLNTHEKIYYIILCVMGLMERFVFYPTIAFILLFICKYIFDNSKKAIKQF